LPVFTVGGIKDPAMAEEILASGKADMVAMTRAQIADPEYANKVREGRENELVHCIRGNQGCIGRVFKGLPITCTVNPGAGRERRFGPGTLSPTDQPARWLVAGGGPAGMKAAAVLAERGHRVTLVEREHELGGQVNLILRTPGRDEFGWITRDLERQLHRHRVDVRLGTEATSELVRELAPDAIMVATGAVPSRTGFSSVNPLVDQLPGADQDNVLSVWDVLLETRPVGRRVVVLDDDGTRYAAGVTEVLLDRGCDVELVSRWPTLFPTTLTTLDMAHLYGRLLGKGLEYRLNWWAAGVEGDRVALFNLYTGAQDTIDDVDTVASTTVSYWRPARPRTTSCILRSRASSPTSAGSATASHPANSTTRSTKASSPAASSGRPRSAISTRASSSASRQRSRSTRTRFGCPIRRRLEAHEPVETERARPSAPTASTAARRDARRLSQTTVNHTLALGDWRRPCEKSRSLYAIPDPTPQTRAASASQLTTGHRDAAPTRASG
jgi:hypothetical protein